MGELRPTTTHPTGRVPLSSATHAVGPRESVSCHVCGTISKALFRCSRCQGDERYCSVECQQADWNRQHKSICRQRRRRQRQQQQRTPTTTTSSLLSPQETKVWAAWNELSTLIGQASLKDASHDYHLAKEQVQSLLHQQQQQQTKHANKNKTRVLPKQPSSPGDMDAQKTSLPHTNGDTAGSTSREASGPVQSFSLEHEHPVPPKDRLDPVVRDDSEESRVGVADQKVGKGGRTRTETTTSRSTTKRSPWSDWKIHVTQLPHLSSLHIQLQATVPAPYPHDNSSFLQSACSSNNNQTMNWTSYFSCQPVQGCTGTTTTSARQNNGTRVGLYYCHPPNLQQQHDNKAVLDPTNEDEKKESPEGHNDDDKDESGGNNGLLLITLDVPGVPHSLQITRVDTATVTTTTTNCNDDTSLMESKIPTCWTWSVRIQYNRASQHGMDDPPIDAGDQDQSHLLSSLRTNATSIVCRMCHPQQASSTTTTSPTTCMNLFADPSSSPPPEGSGGNDEIEQESHNAAQSTNSPSSLNRGLSTYQLPTGHWQDMAEYLSCGGETASNPFWPQPSFDNCTTENVRVGYNPAYLVCRQTVLNRQSYFAVTMLQEDATTAWNGRSWQPSIFNSSSLVDASWYPVVCSRCCSILGFGRQTPTTTRLGPEETANRGGEEGHVETIYFMRHALSSSVLPTTSLSWTTTTGATTSPLQYWIHELVHMAETKGIFTMLLQSDKENQTNIINKSRTCVWMRLWHWTSHEAVYSSHDARGTNKNNNKSKSPDPNHCPLRWYRVAKLVYQIRNEPLESEDDEGPNEVTLPLAWTQSHALCCPPPRQMSRNKDTSLAGSTKTRSNNSSAKKNDKENQTRDMANENGEEDDDEFVTGQGLLKTVTWNAWEMELMEQELRHSFNILSSPFDRNDVGLLVVDGASPQQPNNNSSSCTRTKALVQTTYWAQTGERLTESDCDSRTAGVAHVPLSS